MRLNLPIPGDDRHDAGLMASLKLQADYTPSETPVPRNLPMDYQLLILSAQQALTADSDGARYLAERCIDLDTARANWTPVKKIRAPGGRERKAKADDDKLKKRLEMIEFHKKK